MFLAFAPEKAADVRLLESISTSWPKITHLPESAAAAAEPAAPADMVEPATQAEDGRCPKTVRFNFELGRLLRQIRTSLGLSRNDVANGLGWHLMRLGTYERGDRFLTVTQFATLVDYYNVQPSAVISIAQARARLPIVAND